MDSQDLKSASSSQVEISRFLPKTDGNRPENAVLARGENGMFAKGNAGGPGRPPIASPTEAYKQILAEKGATELAQTVYNDALTARNARDRLAAASEITDRVDGKATQRMDFRGVIAMMPAESVTNALDEWADGE